MCPKQYKFAYLDKYPRLDKPYTVFGQFCHEVLENFHRIYLEPSNKDVSHIDTMQKCFIDAKHKWQPKITKEQLKEAYEIMVDYLKLLSENVPNVISVEKKIWMPIDNEFILYGFIDRIQTDSDGIIHVVDYKTTKDERYLVDRTQLLLYAYTLYSEDQTLTKVRSSYILLKHKMKSLVKEHKINELVECKDYLVKLWLTIKEDKLYRGTPHQSKCRMCDFSTYCEEGKKLLYNTQKVGKSDW
jgi:RecB family exonuclease